MDLVGLVGRERNVSADQYQSSTAEPHSRVKYCRRGKRRGAYSQKKERKRWQRRERRCFPCVLLEEEEAEVNRREKRTKRQRDKERQKEEIIYLGIVSAKRQYDNTIVRCYVMEPGCREPLCSHPAHVIGSEPLWCMHKLLCKLVISSLPDPCINLNSRRLILHQSVIAVYEQAF